MSPSLSTYFPKDTAYFYGYPVARTSGFLNLATPASEELVSARPLVCAGPNVQVVVFANAAKAKTLRVLREDIGLPLVDDSHIITLPETIDDTIVGEERDRLVQEHLTRVLADQQFVMAQPYMGQQLRPKYQIDPNVTSKLNDKSSLEELVPEDYRAKTYKRMENGRELLALDLSQAPIPCVVKVTNSSAGDGVYVCKSAEDFEKAQHQFQDIDTLIILQEYLGDADDLDIQFGIPHKSDEPSAILGFSRQLTSPKGEFLAGIFDDTTMTPTIQRVFDVTQTILPSIRAMGWHGVGGFDVLVRRDKTFTFIDGNLRMTATLAHRMQLEAGLVKSPFVTLSGRFEGGLNSFVREIAPLARLSSPDRCLHPINLSERKGVVSFNGELLYDSPESLRTNIQLLLRKGIKSEVLDILAQQNSN